MFDQQQDQEQWLGLEMLITTGASAFKDTIKTVVHNFFNPVSGNPDTTTHAQICSFKLIFKRIWIMFSLPFTLADYTQLSIYYYYVKLHCQLTYLTILLNH